MMHYYELDSDEQELLGAVESGEFASVKNVKEKIADAVAAAKNSANKTRNINIRVSERLLHKLKVKAIREGMPYQTLVASILHKNSD
jgi:predicted DNA binding CopG/RHH family protein